MQRYQSVNKAISKNNKNKGIFYQYIVFLFTKIQRVALCNRSQEPLEVEIGDVWGKCKCTDTSCGTITSHEGRGDSIAKNTPDFKHTHSTLLPFSAQSEQSVIFWGAGSVAT